MKWQECTEKSLEWRCEYINLCFSRSLALYAYHGLAAITSIFRQSCQFRCIVLTFTIFIFIYSAQELLNLKSNDCDFLLWRTCTLITMSWQICQLLQAWQAWESKGSSISWVDFCWSWCIYLVSSFYFNIVNVVQYNY